MINQAQFNLHKYNDSIGLNPCQVYNPDFMGTEPDDKDAFLTLCGRTLYVTDSELTDDIVTCKDCLNRLEVKRLPGVEG